MNKLTETTRAYKLTDIDGYTRSDPVNSTYWQDGSWHETSGEGTLHGTGWIQAYTHPLVAVLFNTIHSNFDTFRLWELEVAGKIRRDHGLKIGVTRARAVRELTVPAITTEQCITFAILCAAHVTSDYDWNQWAWAWLLGIDRSPESARTAICRMEIYAEDARSLARMLLEERIKASVMRTARAKLSAAKAAIHASLAAQYARMQHVFYETAYKTAVAWAATWAKDASVNMAKTQRINVVAIAEAACRTKQTT